MIISPIGFLIAILGTLGIGFGDFLAGLSARKIDEKKTLLFIFSSQTLFSFFYWLIFNHTFHVSPLATITILIAGIFQAVGLVLFYKSMSLEKISLVSPIFATYSALTILFGIIILKDHLSFLKIFSIFIVFIGTFLASSDFSFGKIKVSKGVIVALSGTLSFAVAFLLMTLVFKYSEYYLSNFLYSFSTFCIALIINRKALRGVRQTKHKLLPMVVGLVYASSNIVWAIALTKIPSSVFGAVGATFPAVTALAGFIFLRERLAKIQFTGIVIILAGLIFLSI